MLAFMKTLPKDAVFSKLDSPVGNLIIIASSMGLHALLWEIDQKEEKCSQIIASLKCENSFSLIQETKKQLREYFQGVRKIFELPLFSEGTSFQKKAWKQLLRIPFGQTISYGEQARRLGDKKKARAVGAANSRNPISIVVPCHRVIGKTGKLTGFGGGLSSKEYLINLERRICCAPG